MRSKHWVNRSKLDINGHARSWYPAFGVLNGKEIYIALAVTPILALVGWMQSNTEMLAVGLAGFGAAIFYSLYDQKSDDGAYRLSRKMKLDYDTAEAGLRDVFTAQRINFEPLVDKKRQTHVYKMPAHNLKISLNPYDLIHGIEHGRDAGLKSMAPEKLGVLITLNHVDKNNEVFVDNLTMAIDEMALQPVVA